MSHRRERFLKMAVFWAVAPYRLVWVYRRFRGLYCLHHQGGESRGETLINWMMEAEQTSETSVNSYQSTRRYNLADGLLHTHRRENLKSYEKDDFLLTVSKSGCKFGVWDSLELIINALFSLHFAFLLHFLTCLVMMMMMMIISV
jgi:hypothetical protein